MRSPYADLSVLTVGDILVDTIFFGICLPSILYTQYFHFDVDFIIRKFRFKMLVFLIRFFLAWSDAVLKNFISFFAFFFLPTFHVDPQHKTLLQKAI
jgi:hypothetical protein